MVVDTHVSRLSQRLGLTANKQPEKIEADLIELLPKKDWIDFSHRLIWHGRRVCQARKPTCEKCGLEKFCPSSTLKKIVRPAARQGFAKSSRRICVTLFHEVRLSARSGEFRFDPADLRRFGGGVRAQSRGRLAVLHGTDSARPYRAAILDGALRARDRLRRRGDGQADARSNPFNPQIRRRGARRADARLGLSATCSIC